MAEPKDYSLCCHCEKRFCSEWRWTLLILSLHPAGLTRIRYGSAMVLVYDGGIRSGLLQLPRRPHSRQPKVCFGRDYLLGAMYRSGDIVIENKIDPPEQVLYLGETSVAPLSDKERSILAESMLAMKASEELTAKRKQ